MSGLERAFASRAKSSSTAALRDSASDVREGLVTRTAGGVSAPPLGSGWPALSVVSFTWQ